MYMCLGHKVLYLGRPLSRVGGALWTFPYPHWHVHCCGRYLGLVQTTTLLLFQELACLPYYKVQSHSRHPGPLELTNLFLKMYVFEFYVYIFKMFICILCVFF